MLNNADVSTNNYWEKIRKKEIAAHSMVDSPHMTGRTADENRTNLLREIKKYL
jgi:hypothetical protein